MPTLQEWLSKQNDQAVSTKLLSVSDANPDLAAQSVKQARANNIPPALTPFEPDPDLAQQEKLTRASGTVQSTKALKQWLNSQPDVVAASVQDDVENMSLIEKTLSIPRATAGGFTGGFFGGISGAAALASGALKPIGDYISKTGISTLSPTATLFSTGGAAEQFFTEQAKGFFAFGETIAGEQAISGPISGGIYSGFQSIGQQLPAIAAGVATANPAVSLSLMSASTTGAEYVKAREKLDFAQAAPYATLQGLIEYATEKLPIFQLFKDLKVDESFLNILGKQILLEIPGEQAATALQDLNEWANLNPEKPFKEYLAERPAAAVQTLVATIVGVGGNVAVTKGVNMLLERDTYSQQATETADLLRELDTLAKASVVRERDVDTFEGFLQTVTQDSPVESLYIDSQTLMESGLAEVLAGQSPTVAAQLEQASAGTMIRIPTAEVMGRFNQELSPLLPDMRVDPNGMSQKEAEEYVSTRGEQLRAEVETVLAQSENESAAQEARTMVRDTVAQELMATGRVTQDVADNYALLTSTFYHVMAQRMGTTADKLFGEQRVRVLGAGRGEFEQITAPEFQLWFQDSKIVDQNGKPLVVYRGALSDVAERGGQDGFIYFSKDPKVAAGGERGFIEPEVLEAAGISPDLATVPEGLRVVPAYLSIKNPASLDDVRQIAPNAKTIRDALPALKNAGFDGFVSDYEIVAFDKTQVRSAISGAEFQQVGVSEETDQDQENSLTGMRVSPRLPTSVKVTEDPLAEERLQPDLDTAKREPAKLAKNVELMSAYPNFVGLTGDPETRVEKMISDMVENLVWLHNNWKPEYRNRSRMWYVGGNRIAHRWAARFGIEPQQVAGVIAATSPQKDWFQNVSLAERILEAVINNSDVAWDSKMSDLVRSRDWGGKLSKELGYVPVNEISRLEGKTLRDLFDAENWDRSLLDMAVWIRAWDEANNPQVARIITPEGAFTNEFDQTKGGQPVALRWQSFATIAKTLEILKAKTPDEISKVIGANHKVRSFYNNIIAPYSGGDVTIDTHAVAAALLRPLGSNDIEVSHNFGSGKAAVKDKKTGEVTEPAIPGPANSAITGLNGTYSIYAEAYRRAAEQVGLLPREMQSITWEAVRGMFRPEQKTAKNKAAVNQIWQNVAEGKLDVTEARNQIAKLVGGIADPAWVRSPAGTNEAAADSSYAEQLPETGVPGRGAGVGRGDGVGAAGVAPRLFQGEGQEVRGSFSPEELTIRLTKAQDLSTFLHESGHFYLHMLVNLASRPDAPADVRKDAETILNWFGVKGTPETNQFDTWLNMSVDEQRPSHERFARSFEVYLAEGKAPSTELQPMFDRFRSWLMSVYRSLMERAKATFGREVSFGKAMQAELNDEVRAVFDRLLATQEEIEAREAAQSMGMLFKTEAEAQKFGIDWNAYQAQGEAATQQAISDLAAKSIQDMKWLENARSRLLTKLQKEEKETRRSVRSMVRPEIMSQPVYRAWSYLTGPLTDDPNAEPTSRFDPEYVEQVTASKEVVAQLRKLRMVAGPADIKKGVSGEHPDVVAETFGFSSGSELIRAILASPTPDEAINAETDARMLRDFSDLSTAEGRNNAVNAALANDARTRMVETELSALEQAMAASVVVGGRRQRTLPGAAKAFARSVVNRLKIRDVRVSQYSGSAARAARNADRAVKRGKLAEAALEKRNQLVNNYAARFAGEALDNVKSGLAYLKKFTKEGTRKNIDPEYLDQIDRILERFDLRQKTLRELDRRSALAQFIENQKELGIEPDLPAHIVNEAQAVNYKNLTVEEFAGLVDSIRQIEHFGRLKRKLLLAKDKREFDALMAEIRESVIANDRGRVADNRTRTDLGSILVRAFKGFTAAHRKMSSIVYEIDGFKDGGPLWDALVRTANERGNWEADKQAELTTRLAQLLKGLPKERAFSKGQFFPRIGVSLNQEARLAVALNWGNDGNRQRLLDGRNWTTDGVQQVLDSLSKEEWDFVQGVWDTFESLRPEIARVERSLMGKEPEWIEAVPIQTKFGTYRGGYYPAVYDPAESLRTEQMAAEEEAKRQLRGARTAATVRSNFVKGRAEEVKGRPILLTMDATFNGLTDVVHYLAYKEWLVDANRILRAVDGTIRERYGAEMTRQLRTAVEAIAAGEQNNPHALDKPLRHIRIGSMVAGLGFNIVNALMQPIGLTQSIVRVGPKYIAQGVAAFAKNPIKLGTTVLEKSSFMRNRKRTQNRELNDLRNGLRGKTESRQFIDGAMFLPMTAIQMTVDIPTWWGAYQKAQTEGYDEETSIQIADQAVLASQGGGQMKDLAAIQRGSEFVKIFTVFYGYFNTAYNLGVERIRGTNPRSPAQVARLATDLLLIYTVPAVFGLLIKEAFKIGDEDDDEEIAKKLAAEQVSFLFGTMVGVREAAGAAQIMFGLSTSGGLGYNGPAGLRFFNELNKFAQQANQDELDRAFVRAGVNVAGIALHLPSAQINRTIDGVIAMSEGRTQNPVALVGGAPPQ